MERNPESDGENYKGQRMLQRAEELSFLWAYKKEALPAENELVLLDNVQFIYELSLAQLELQSFGVEYQVTNGLRQFELKRFRDEDELRKRLAYFKSVRGRPTDYFQIIQANRTRSVNQYLTHWIYPYKGKFHPQMIRALLNIIGLQPGEIILDSFVGSGTAAIEAQLLGINCIGIDVSPLCILQSKVKTESIDVLEEILSWKAELAKVLSSTSIDLEEKFLDRLIGSIRDSKVRNFFTMLKLVAISDNARRGKDLFRSIAANLDLMVASVQDHANIVANLNLKPGSIDIRNGDSRVLPLGNESVDGIVTSPPYSIALDYVENDSHALEELGYNLSEIRERFVGVRGKGQAKIKLYNEDMIKSLSEMFRVLKKGRYAVIVIGNATYMGQEVNTVEFVTEHAKDVGFELVKKLDKIIFGLYNVMQKESILVFRKT